MPSEKENTVEFSRTTSLGTNWDDIRIVLREFEFDSLKETIRQSINYREEIKKKEKLTKETSYDRTLNKAWELVESIK